MNLESYTNDQEARRNSAKEGQNFDRASLSQSIEVAAGELSDETLTILFGDDEWDKNEYGARLQVWADDPLYSEEQLTHTLKLLKEMKALDTDTEVGDKEAKIKDLNSQIWSQPENPPSLMAR